MSNCQNGVPPMYLAWENVTVTTDQKAINRGVQISMGSPAQILSLRPSTTDDNLYVVNKANCAPQYNDSCAGLYGGVFDYSSSKTFAQISEAQWNGTEESNPNQLSFVHFNDMLTFGNASIYGYPSMYDQPGYGGQGVFPLGSDSDLLKIAVESGAIPSSVFGLWTGSRSINHPVDGSIVLGGYDTTRVNGDLTTFKSQEKCEFCVVVTGIEYEDVTGAHNLFSNSSESLQINLQPSERVLNVPQNVWENFQTVSNGVYNATSGYLQYPTSNPPTGNLTVTLQNGYKTTIPTEELFYLPRTYDENGQYSLLNDTYLIPTILNTTNDGYVLNWGVPYLTMNYIIGDYKRAQFKMAPAIRTDFDAQGGGYVLQASCDPKTSATASATSSATAGGALTTSSAAAVSHGGGGTNTGAIIGGVVGGVLGLIAIVGGLALLFYRSRRRRNAPPPPGPTMGGEPGMSQYTGSVADRRSHWTAMSPTEIPSELGNNQKVGANVHVNQWLSSQASDTQTVTDTTSPNLNAHHMDRPFEMPAQSWDTR
ncbi:hypothetical protein H2202_008805 [Exophiala xenobiotica]|nr:hypothetical protein H2202_008805 [Exophiala xenobiotica]KAK5212311.1 hypothetical protein LTR41_002553 [Exophiala xenobiotica]KAK5219606.1 hypothetical protein LTR72_007990 [Exophiala xenobiotica]KAK5231737.1 hypothetical protein LTR47_007140 [Exophiala xenobiotica]KAK5244695.1 hypothetical protein LTS06_009754 [Exophiala xenobiotica]